jgi:hypothetical protein
MRFAGRCRIVVIIVISVMVGITATTTAAGKAQGGGSPAHVGAVSRSLLHFLSSQGPGLRQATDQSAATVTKAAAIRDALRHGQWHPIAATGISLVRTSHPAGDVPRGTLAWLVSVRPRAPVYDSADDPPANYVVVVIDARDGHLLGDMAGYHRLSGHRAGPSWSEGEWTAASTATPPSASNAGNSQDIGQLVHILGVLRRPQRPADRDAALLRGLAGGYRPVLSLMRLAETTSWRQKIFLVPFTPQHAQTGLLQTSSGLAVATAAGGACCSPADEVQRGEVYFSGYKPNFLVLVVPDHVARIAITLRTGPRSHRPPVIVATVHHNVAAFLTPFNVRTVMGDTLKWYASSGRLLKRLRP